MAYDFKGKKYLVTGAAGDIGRAIAENLAGKGAKVFALDFVKESLDDLVGKVPAIIAVHQDLTNWDETTETVDKLGDIDGLVNCAGILVPGVVMDVTKKVLCKHYDVNINAPINLMQIVGKKMIAAGNGGSIVNMSSAASKGAHRGTLAYNISKAGLDMATKIFALELGQHKIRVNSVNPGLIPTGMTRPLFPDEYFEQHVDKIPLNKQPEIQNVADLVMFLLSDRSAMITGTNNLIDGGYACQLP